MIVFMVIHYYPSRDFDAKKWRDDVEKRYELSEDLIESKVLVGKTMDEVRQLLGDDYDISGKEEWTYYLGVRPQLFPIDHDYLRIEFKDGRVVKVEQRTT